MRTEEILAAMRRLKVETSLLACMGCGREHDCGIHGCQIVREAADLIEKLTDRCARYAEEIAVLQDREKWVPVTRCKDCKHSTLPSELTQRYGKPGTLTCHNMHAPSNRRNVGSNDFCSYGEPKEGAE